MYSTKNFSADMNCFQLWEIVSSNPDKPWSWYKLSKNPNITWEIVSSNPDKPWNWYGLSQNPNITWEIVSSNPDKPWNWEKGFLRIQFYTKHTLFRLDKK